MLQGDDIIRVNNIVAKHDIYTAYVSMGVMGASAPMVFESVGVSTHGFWQLLSEFYQFP